MSANLRNLTPLYVGGAFLSGLALGGLAGAKLMEKRIEELFNERLAQETESIRAFYGAVHKKDYPTPSDAAQELIPEPVAEALSDYRGEERQKVAYHKIVKSDTQVVEESQSVETSDESAVVEQNVFAHSEDRGKIYVITEGEFDQNETDYIQNTLTYYSEDNVLTDEREDRIEDVDSVVCLDAFKKFGHFSNDPNTVHVRNETLQLEFEIVRRGSYGKEVLGLDEPLQTPRRRGE